jgi:hypothetical protein
MVKLIHRIPLALMIVVSSTIALAQVPITDVERGQQAYASGRYGEALVLFQKCLQTQPKQPVLLCWLGSTALQLGVHCVY